MHSFKTSHLLAVLVLACITDLSFAVSKNGFDLNDASISSNDILQGGPPKDGIPSIDNPQFVSTAKATDMKDTDRVLGIVMEGQAKAYPIKILDWHEIVNDKINDKHFAITFCPLCGTGAAFSSHVKGDLLQFGVSGLLYESDVLLYDRNTESLWSQLLGRAVSGQLKDIKLTPLPVTHTTWKDWKNTHSKTLVLSIKTGFNRDYKHSPYGEYKSSSTLYFKVSNTAPAIYHPKEQVMGLEVNGKFKAYPFVELDKNGQTGFTDHFEDRELSIHWNTEAKSATITNNDGTPVVTTTGYWFAWYTFHPDTDVYKAITSTEK